MAASKKSTVLGLSLWSGTDKPRRVDFVEDNTALETQVGGHLNNTDLHLDSARKARIDQPYEVRTYTGTGTASRSLVFSFRPKAAIVFAVGKGASEYTGKYTKQYMGVSAAGQHSLGLILSTTQVQVMQDQAEPVAGGAMASLNENGTAYAILAFR